MKVVRGVRGVEKVAMAHGDTQQVRVEEDDGAVLLVLSACSYPARLTPEEARYIAEALKRAADGCVV
jgi:hypothetical protein